MQILVFGKDGQLGKAFRSFFEEHFSPEKQSQIQYVGREDCDLANPAAVQALLNQVKPKLIINTAAYTAVDKAQSESSLADAINHIAPQVMAHYAAKHDATLLHYSTDYVFDGSKAGFYVEEDTRNPLSEYGKSKAAGEIAIESAFANASLGQYAILRTSWVYGDGGNFIKTILRLGKDRDSLSVIEDQYGVPTSADWLAAVSLDLVMNDQGQIQAFTSGIYHAVPPGETNWYELACTAIQAAHEIEGVPAANYRLTVSNIKPIPATEYPLPAPRPMNSRMLAQKLKQAIAKHHDVSKLQRWNVAWADQVRSYVQKLIKEQVI